MRAFTPTQFATWARSRPNALAAELGRAARENLSDARRLAVTYSSGTRTTAQLRAAGHPYARRDPTDPNPEVVNAQSGRFRDSWQSLGPVRFSGGYWYAVRNTDPNAKYLLGTRTMIPRPIWDAVRAGVRPIRAARAARAVRNALRH